ncbi:MAG: dihydrofolate reductase [Paludibacteraceae bacterium]|nr:dihydrofolate reductase [Paludibacteraceae bacterium]
MKYKFLLFELFVCVTGLFSQTVIKSTSTTMNTFNYVVDQFADVQVLRYEVPGFESLPVKQKELIYYLSEAALQGRDILFDQNYKHNLLLRKTLETIYLNYSGDRRSEEFVKFTNYLKRVFFSNGIHHHYGMQKFEPEFSTTFFVEALASIPEGKLKAATGESTTAILNTLLPVLFDPNVASKRVNQSAGEDLIRSSANNYYEGVTQAEVEAFYAAMRKPNDDEPLSYGLNSRLVKKKDGTLEEERYKLGGRYSEQIERIIYWLSKAQEVAENDNQKKIIKTLIAFYQTGDLKTFDEYSIRWVKDQKSHIDFLNGFIETYGDPLGIKASWEAIVNFKNIEATKRTEIISSNAQWFEDNSPIDSRFKKKKVKGVSAKVITVAMLGGDCYPATSIGINLPNANWIRQRYGSKSVTIENITDAYDKASYGNGFNEEFMLGREEIERKQTFGTITDNLHTDLHECLGHGSGQLLPGVSQDALKAYGATVEEARADLFGLYYMADEKMLQLGLLPTNEAYKTAYYQYMMNGLMTQLTRIKEGDNIEESHMRNRQLIARWAYEKGAAQKVVELVQLNGKSFVKINDYTALRNLFGDLLKEIQRIKSEGDYESAKKLVENYAVKVDARLHAEVLARYKKLNLAPYKGFVNPIYTPVYNNKQEIVDVQVSYNEGYLEQHLRYGK